MSPARINQTFHLLIPFFFCFSLLFFLRKNTTGTNRELCGWIPRVSDQNKRLSFSFLPSLVFSSFSFLLRVFLSRWMKRDRRRSFPYVCMPREVLTETLAGTRYFTFGICAFLGHNKTMGVERNPEMRSVIVKERRR